MKELKGSGTDTVFEQYYPDTIMYLDSVFHKYRKYIPYIHTLYNSKSQVYVLKEASIF